MVTAGLQPLEFTDCLLDSPEFRENLNKHEKELEKTSQQIKRIIKEVKDLLAAAKSEFYECPLFSNRFGKNNIPSGPSQSYLVQVFASLDV